MSIILSERSLSRLDGVHADLVRVVKRAAATSNIDFTVLEGLRSLERQKTLVARGASKTMKSRHLTGHAVDLAPFVDGQVVWAWPLYHKLAVIVKAAAKDENVPITWGGDWARFRDGPHWELNWKDYPSK